MLSIKWISSLELLYNAPYFQINYSDNNGASEQYVDSLLEKCGLPTLETFRSYPSFSEIGSFEHFYIGKVLLEDLPYEVRLNIARMASRYSIFDYNRDSIDHKLALFQVYKQKLDLINRCL